MSVLLAACGDKGGEDQAATTSGEPATDAGSQGMSSTPTTGDDGVVTAPPGTMGTGSAAPPDDSQGGSTLVDGTDSSDEAGSTGAPSGPCEAECEAVVACEIEADLAACVAACQGELAQLDGACLEAVTTSLGCLAGLDCEQLGTAIAGAGPHPCLGAVHDVEAACEGDGCGVAAGGDEMGSMCLLRIDCAGEPLREMTCDTKTCLCTEDGVMTGSCDADGVCENLLTIQDFGPPCCGFPPVDP